MIIRDDKFFEKYIQLSAYLSMSILVIIGLCFYVFGWSKGKPFIIYLYYMNENICWSFCVP